MAHNLTVHSGGIVEMFSAGHDPVWHQLGQRTEQAVTSAAALQLAGLDWRVHCLPVQLGSDTVHERPTIPTHKAVVRLDTGEVLGVVGRRYRPIQNHQAFEWLDDVVGERLAIFETAGSIHGGRTVWALLRLPSKLRIRESDDLVLPYLLAVNTHDGSRAMGVFSTAIRVVCNNTLTLALRCAGASGLTLRHTENALSRVQQARRVLQIAHEQFRTFQEQADLLASVRIDDRQAARYFDLVWPDDPSNENHSRSTAVRDRLMLNLSDERQRLPGIDHTYWAAFNALSQWTDHDRATRGATGLQRASNRLHSMWLGDSAELKRRAWDTALELARSN
jgi:phage/plasmid-like protein (TIGR03299 family)